MKMAKASESDLNMAMKLANYLDSIERGQMPDDLSDDSESIEWLDTRDSEQMDTLIDGIKTLLNQGSVSRVIWGMAVVCDPSNKCLDPDADTIEHHPDLIKAAEQRDELEEQRDTAWAELRRIRVAIGANMDESTADEAERVKQQRDELLAALELMLNPTGLERDRIAVARAAIAKVKPPFRSTELRDPPEAVFEP